MQRDVHQTGIHRPRAHLRQAGDRLRIEHALADDAQASCPLGDEDVADSGRTASAHGFDSPLIGTTRIFWPPASRIRGPSSVPLPAAKPGSVGTLPAVCWPLTPFVRQQTASPRNARRDFMNALLCAFTTPTPPRRANRRLIILRPP